MLLQSPIGFFEDTKENGVKLFIHVNRDTGFDLHKLKRMVPEDLCQKMIDEYLLRPRTVDDYCNEVWALHRSAIAKLEKQKEQRDKFKLKQLNQRKKGEKLAALPDPVTYLQLLEDFSIYPTRKANFDQFLNECKELIEKHWVTLRVPKSFEEDHYAEFTNELATYMESKI